MQYAWDPLCESLRTENPGPEVVVRSRTEAAGYDQIAPPYTAACTEIRDEKLPGHLLGRRGIFRLGPVEYIRNTWKEKSFWTEFIRWPPQTIDA